MTTTIEISVKKRTGKLFFDGIRVSDGRFILDTRKVHVRVRRQCAIAPWINDRLAGGHPFAVRQGQHSEQSLPNLQKTFKQAMGCEVRPVVYEGLYKDLYVVLKPVNRSSWRVLLGIEYFELLNDAGLHFESPLSNGMAGTVSGRHVMNPLRIVTQRGALVGFLMPCRPGVNMAEVRKQVVKPCEATA